MRSKFIVEIQVGRLLVEFPLPDAAITAPLEFHERYPANDLKIVHAYCDSVRGLIFRATLPPHTSEQRQVVPLSKHTEKLWVPSPDKALTSRGTGSTAPTASRLLKSTTEGMAMVSITRYPMHMTGKKLRKKLGMIVEERFFADHDFRLRHKFRRIPKAKRLNFLIRAAKRETGIRLSFAEMWIVRRRFDAHKHEWFPMSRDCECYCCENKARVRHHVTSIINGGKNKQNNIVPLCDRCHYAIHPDMGR